MTDIQNDRPRGPGRPTNAEIAARANQMRPPISDSAARAAERAREIREGVDFGREAANEFDLPDDIIPDGWSYEWKRATVYGKPDADNLMEMNRAGWTPVPAERHTNLMPVGWEGATIERKGLILMERPLVLVLEARQRADREARKAVTDKEASLGQTPANTMPRDADPRIRPKVETGYFREIPAD